MTEREYNRDKIKTFTASGSSDKCNNNTWHINQETECIALDSSYSLKVKDNGHSLHQV